MFLVTKGVDGSSRVDGSISIGSTAHYAIDNCGRDCEVLVKYDKRQKVK
jgi:hypothetical protein